MGQFTPISHDKETPSATCLHPSMAHPQNSNVAFNVTLEHLYLHQVNKIVYLIFHSLSATITSSTPFSTF